MRTSNSTSTPSATGRLYGDYNDERARLQVPALMMEYRTEQPASNPLLLVLEEGGLDADGEPVPDGGFVTLLLGQPDRPLPDGRLRRLKTATASAATTSGMPGVDLYYPLTRDQDQCRLKHAALTRRHNPREIQTSLAYARAVYLNS